MEARKIFGLKSSNFKAEISDNNVKFSVIGYGHGVGLSQTGSNTLAKEGKDYKEIINHYYKNIHFLSSIHYLYLRKHIVYSKVYFRFDN